MIAVDTNVLVRFLVKGDDPGQSSKAIRIFKNNEVWVSLTVVLETEWVLRTNFHLPRNGVLQALEALAGLPQVAIQEGPAVVLAIASARQGLDFADALHLATAGQANELVTFDREFAKRAAKQGRIDVRLI